MISTFIKYMQIEHKRINQTPLALITKIKLNIRRRVTFIELNDDNMLSKMSSIKHITYNIVERQALLFCISSNNFVRKYHKCCVEPVRHIVRCNDKVSEMKGDW